MTPPRSSRLLFRPIPDGLPVIPSVGLLESVPASCAFSSSGTSQPRDRDQRCATNYPLVQLLSLKSEQTRWLPPAPAEPFSNTAFTSQPVADSPSGCALVMVLERHPQHLQHHPDPGPAAVLFDLPAAGLPLTRAGAEGSSWEQRTSIRSSPRPRAGLAWAVQRLNL